VARARAGEDFGTLAREFSDAPDRDKTGGQLGLRSADRYPPLFIQATQPLRAGDIAGPVRSDAGFHVLKVVDKRQASLPGMTVTQSQARHILLRPSAQLSESVAKERLTDFRRRILAGQADFGTLARENSQDGSAREGGDLGWASPGQFVPEFEDVMNRLAPGQISEPLVSRFGVHLIQLVARRETTLSPREQREIVRNLVREKKLDEAFKTWAQEVRGRAYVEFRDPVQ
jgi:peptidyl-prolyl cis-trans isomerase SurA